MDTNPITKQTEQILIDGYERFYRLAYSYVQNREDALDVVQESACKAIRDCGQVKNRLFIHMDLSDRYKYLSGSSEKK